MQNKLRKIKNIVFNEILNLNLIYLIIKLLKKKQRSGYVTGKWKIL